MSKFYDFMTDPVNNKLIKNANLNSKRMFILFMFLIHHLLQFSDDNFNSEDDFNLTFILPFVNNDENINLIINKYNFNLSDKQKELLKEFRKIIRYYNLNTITLEEFYSNEITSFFNINFVSEMYTFFKDFIEQINKDISISIPFEKIYKHFINKNEGVKRFEIYNDLISQGQVRVNKDIQENIKSNVPSGVVLSYPLMMAFDYKMIYWYIYYGNDFNSFLRFINLHVLFDDFGYLRLDEGTKNNIVSHLVNILLPNIIYTYQIKPLINSDFFTDIVYNRKTVNSPILNMSKLYVDVLGLIEGQKYYLSYREELFDHSIKAEAIDDKRFKLMIDLDFAERFKCEKLEEEGCKSQSDLCNWSITSIWHKTYHRLKYGQSISHPELSSFDPTRYEKALQNLSEKEYICKAKKYENSLTRGNFHVGYEIKGDEIEYIVYEVVYQGEVFDKFGLILKKVYEGSLPYSTKNGEFIITKNKYYEYYYFFPTFNVDITDIKKKTVSSALNFKGILYDYNKLNDDGLNLYISSFLIDFFNGFKETGEMDSRDFVEGKHNFVGISRGAWCANVAPFLLINDFKLNISNYYVYAFGSPKPGPGIADFRRVGEDIQLIKNPRCINVIRCLYFFNNIEGNSGFLFDPFNVFPVYLGADNEYYGYNIYSLGSLFIEWDYFDYLVQTQPIVELPTAFLRELPSFIPKKWESIKDFIEPNYKGFFPETGERIQDFSNKYCLPLNAIKDLLHSVDVYSPPVMYDFLYQINEVIDCNLFVRQRITESISRGEKPDVVIPIKR